MTTQIPDGFVFRGEDFVVLELGTDIFDSQDFATPEDFGMKSQMTSTANRRGFAASYELSDDGLRLRQFALSERAGHYVPIGGVSATRDPDGSYGCYEGLNLLIQFSGRVRIARGHNRDPAARRTRTRTSSPFPYGQVFDLTLDDGKLVSIADRTDEPGKDIPPLAA